MLKNQTHNKVHVLLICAVLVLATLITFEQVRLNEFVDYDDGVHVTENPHVNNGLTRESIIWAFATITAPHLGHWQPLTWLSHMLDCELFGLNPLWHHLTNLCLHIANTLLLFYVLKRMTGALWPSAFVAAAFALHPLHVESVAWVTERRDVLSGFFWMLTIAAYIRYTEHPGIGRYLPILLCFALGLMSKSMLVTLPFVLLLLDYWPLGRLSKQALLEKIPLLFLVAISCVIAFIAAKEYALSPNVSLAYRTLNALSSYARYLAKMIYPTRLAVLYPLTYWLGPMTQRFFGTSVFDYYVGSFGEIFLIIFFSGILIGSISSFLAIKKYLKK